MVTSSVLPHHIQQHWDKVKLALNVDKWDAETIVEVINGIRSSSLVRELAYNKKEYDKPATYTFKQLYEFLSDSEEFAGDVSKLWGGVEFNDHNVNPKIKSWFINHTVPHIAKLILDLPTLFTTPISLLETKEQPALVLSKHQCASLLAASFFCAMHVKCQPLPRDKFQSLVNFDSMLYSCKYNPKFLMMMNYFERTRLNIPKNDFTIQRLQLDPRPGIDEWCANVTPLSNFIIDVTGGITETAPADVLHVDFANAYIGGGVLGGGAVQEEIMFSVCPELLVSLIFCSVMEDDEAIVLIGAEKFCLHKGYNLSLKFAGNFVDVEGPVCRVAMDASCYGWGRNKAKQWTTHDLLRDLNKAFVAFKHNYPAQKSAVATGNWGCGAFGGHVQLKSMLQWLAASACFRPVKYYTFQDPNAYGLSEVVELLTKVNATVGHLMDAILNLAENLDLEAPNPGKALFPFLIDHFSSDSFL